MVEAEFEACELCKQMRGKESRKARAGALHDYLPMHIHVCTYPTNECKYPPDVHHRQPWPHKQTRVFMLWQRCLVIRISQIREAWDGITVGRSQNVLSHLMQPPCYHGNLGEKDEKAVAHRRSGGREALVLRGKAGFP